MKLWKMIRRHRVWIGVVLLLVTAGAVWAVMRAAAPPGDIVTFQTAQVRRDSISVTISGTGNLEFYEPVEAWPSSSGKVASIAVEEGQEVSAGDTLYTMDSATADATAERALVTYRQAQEGVARAEAALSRARSALADLRERREQQQATLASSQPATQTATSQTATVTDADISAATTDVTVAEAGLTTAKASRTSAKRSYDEAVEAKNDLAVTAPAAGIVWSIAIEEGDAINGSGTSSVTSASSETAGTGGATSGTGSSVPMTLVGQGALGLKLAVNEVDLPTLAVGQPAEVEIDALPDLSVTGRVQEIARDGAVTNGVVTFDVWIKFDATDSALRPGMSATVEIVTAVTESSLIVPNAAVESDDYGYHVLVLNNAGAAPSRIAIEPGLSNDTHTQVLSGLSEGDTVVTGTVKADTEGGNGMLLMPGGAQGGGAPGGGAPGGGAPGGGAPGGGAPRGPQ